MKSIRSIIFYHLSFTVSAFFLVLAVSFYFFVGRIMTQFVVDDSAHSLSFVTSNIRTNYNKQLQSIDSLASLGGFAPYRQDEAKGQIRRYLSFDNIHNSIHMYREDGTFLFSERRKGVPVYRIRKNFSASWMNRAF